MSVLPPRKGAATNRRWLWLGVGLVVLLFAAGYILAREKLWRAKEQSRLTADGELEPFSSWDYLERFKYGSIGVEDEQGIPYWIWLVLPRVFPEYLPGSGGYAALGIVWEPGEEMPVGFSKKHIGYDRVAFNCALCHTATYRVRQSDGRLSNTIIEPGGPAIRFDPQAYLNFISRCVHDPRFNANTLLDAIQYNTKLSWLDKAIYRYLLIPGTRKTILEQSESNAWMLKRPIWGPGRIDPFNPVKFGMLEMDPTQDHTIGNSDMMPLWEMARRSSRDGIHLHWDGLSTNLVDCCIAGALGDGAIKKSLPVEHIRDIADTIRNKLQAPKYKGRVRSDLLDAGRQIFGQHCAECHRADPDFTDGALSNTVIVRQSVESSPSTAQQAQASTADAPVTRGISTDENRLLMWNPSLPADSRQPFAIYNDFGNGYEWDLNTFVPTKGYVAVPLNGLWLRAPYLHNGSVPTLEDLLNPPMPQATLQTLMNQATPGTFEALRNRLSRADSASSLTRQQLMRDLEQLRPAVDRLIAGARSLGFRPPIFYRGSDVLDGNRVGFLHTSDAVPTGMLAVPYFTAITGNGNSGHLYGTTLTDREKQELVEYLKTL